MSPRVVVPVEDHETARIGIREPSVTDDGVSRRLYFGPDYIQSEMLVDDPYALNLAYTQKMMAALLFVPKPKHIVIVGLGGGSLTKFCHRQLPKTRVTTIEIDARVIALAPAFEVPVDDPRLQIVHADACDWFARDDRERVDLVMLDGYTDGGIASGFGDPQFYRNIRARLRPDGLLAANILVTPETLRQYKQTIADVFDDHLLIQRVVPDGNQVIFAFNQWSSTPDWAAIGREAKKLALRHELDFPAFARNLRRAHERRAQDQQLADDNLALI